VTFAGIGNAFELLLIRLTASPPAGASPLSATVPVLICPETTFAGLKDSIVTTGGTTVRPPPRALPLGKVAVMVTGALTRTGNVVTLKVPLDAPPAMLKLAGTVATAGLLLISVTVRPLGGAGPVRIRVSVALIPPVTELGLMVRERIAAGFTVKIAVTLLTPRVAVTVTLVTKATPTVVAVNVCEVLPAGTVTEPGTMTEGSELANETAIPPAGATSLMVTVPVEPIPPFTLAGLKLRRVTAGGGTVIVVVPHTEPVHALIVVEPVANA